MDKLVKAAVTKTLSRNVKVIDDYLNKQGHFFPQSAIKDSISRITAVQVNKQIKKKKIQNSIVSPILGYILQIDLMDVSKISKANDSIKYLLIAVDIYSRYLTVIPMGNKTTATSLKALKKLLKNITYKPNVIMSDNGSEFINKPVKKLFKSRDIEHRLTEVGDHNRQGIVESMIGTLRDKLKLYQDITGTKRYIDELPDIVTNYNETVHSTTKRSPLDIYTLKKRSKQVIKTTTDSFKVNDYVRVLRKKATLDKGRSTYSVTIYQIIEKVKNRYKLNNNKTYLASNLIPSTKSNDSKPVANDRKRLNSVNRALREIVDKPDIQSQSDIDKIVKTRSKRVRKPNPKYA